MTFDPSSIRLRNDPFTQTTPALRGTTKWVRLLSRVPELATLMGRTTARERAYLEQALQGTRAISDCLGPAPAPQILGPGQDTPGQDIDPNWQIGTRWLATHLDELRALYYKAPTTAHRCIQRLTPAESNLIRRLIQQWGASTGTTDAEVLLTKQKELAYAVTLGGLSGRSFPASAFGGIKLAMAGQWTAPKGMQRYRIQVGADGAFEIWPSTGDVSSASEMEPQQRSEEGPGAGTKKSGMDFDWQLQVGELAHDLWVADRKSGVADAGKEDYRRKAVEQLRGRG